MADTQQNFTPTNNTPSAAIKRGDPYFRMLETITGACDPTSDGTSIYWIFTEGFRAIEVGPYSEIDEFQISYYDKGTGEGRQFLLDVRNPYVSLITAIPVSSGGVVATMVIRPRQFFPTNKNVKLDVLFHFEDPGAFRKGRPAARCIKQLSVLAGTDTGLVNGTDNWNNPGSLSDQSPRPCIMGRKKVVMFGRNDSAQISRWQIYGQKYEYDAAGTSNTLESDLIYDYTSDGTANDAFSFEFDNTSSNYQWIGYKVTNTSGVTAMTGTLVMSAED